GEAWPGRGLFGHRERPLLSRQHTHALRRRPEGGRRTDRRGQGDRVMDVRACTSQDLPAAQAIYAHHVLHGTGTFEDVPPSLEEMTARHAGIMANDRFPFLVAVQDGAVLGFAYASAFRDRAAYRYTCESSVYI